MRTLRIAAYLFAGVFILIGVLGFIPALAPNNLLLGIFEASPLHNVIHLATGAIALLVALAGETAIKWYFRVFAVIYGLVTLVGLIQGTTVLGLIGVNLADNLLHLAIAVVSFYFGYIFRASLAYRRTPTRIMPKGI